MLDYTNVLTIEELNFFQYNNAFEAIRFGILRGSFARISLQKAKYLAEVFIPYLKDYLPKDNLMHKNNK